MLLHTEQYGDPVLDIRTRRHDRGGPLLARRLEERRTASRWAAFRPDAGQALQSSII
jgi:hypothetical protein